MGSGGARARSGPPPDPNAIRRDRADDPTWTTLPAEGRDGPAPAWPLSPTASELEAEMWTGLWKKPQAVEWERLGVEVDVALYTRRLIESAQPGAPVNVGTLVRQLSDSLGLSVPGMRSLRWRIAPTETQRTPVSATSRQSARGRLKVVDPDASA